MNIDGARRVMETTCQETANQYLRFGWRLINQYVVEATPDTPAAVKYVLASIQRLEDTRLVVPLSDPAIVNQYEITIPGTPTAPQIAAAHAALLTLGILVR